MPLELYSGIPLRHNQSLIINGGSKPMKTFTMFNKFLPTEEERKRLTELSKMNSSKFGDSLKKWSDYLFSVFYRIRKLCVNSDSALGMCGIKLGSCKNTNWSSYATDPKSSFDVINKTTGTFNIW